MLSFTLIYLFIFVPACLFVLFIIFLSVSAFIYLTRKSGL